MAGEKGGKGRIGLGRREERGGEDDRCRKGRRGEIRTRDGRIGEKKGVHTHTHRLTDTHTWTLHLYSIGQDVG